MLRAMEVCQLSLLLLASLFSAVWAKAANGLDGGAEEEEDWLLDAGGAAEGGANGSNGWAIVELGFVVRYDL